jgi:dolichyl-phosphate-mannose--protein O-mannosyl transferase
MKPKQTSAKKKTVNPKYLYWTGLVIIAIVYFKVYASTFDYKLDMNGDNVYYYSLGNALADGKGYVDVIGFNETPHNRFPPGYPFIVSLAIRAGCGIAGIKILNGVFLFFACVILYHLFYRITKNIFLTFAVTLMVATNYHLLRSATIMMSEIPFLFFTSLTLLLFSFLLDRKKRDIPYWLLLFGVSAGAVAA